jgi:hypothetical protein
MRIPAGDIEGLVRDRLRRFFSSRAQMAEALAPLELDARAFDAALHKASELSQRWLAVPHIELTRIVRQIVERATVSADGIELRLDRGKLAITLTAKEKNQPPDTELIILSIEARLCRAGKGKRLIIENCATPEINAGLVEMIREAFKIRGQLLSESADDSVEAMSARLGINKHRLTCLIRLSYLAPEIVRALLEGRHPIELTPTRLLSLSRACRSTGRTSASSSASALKYPSKSGRNASHPTTRNPPSETKGPAASPKGASRVSAGRDYNRPGANIRNYRDNFDCLREIKVVGGNVRVLAGGPEFEPGLTESESRISF